MEHHPRPEAGRAQKTGLFLGLLFFVLLLVFPAVAVTTEIRPLAVFTLGTVVFQIDPGVVPDWATSIASGVEG